MYIRSLTIDKLKRIDHLNLAFPDLVKGRRGRAHMPWTVLVGENGTGKTAILQAIAMTAAGSRQVNNLVGKGVGHLVDRRQGEHKVPMQVEARFAFPEAIWRRDELFPNQGGPVSSRSELRLGSRVTLDPGAETIFGASWYEQAAGVRMAGAGDPLDSARSQRLPWWFVAAYGVARILPDSAFRPAGLAQTDRLRPLFDPTMQLTSTSFANYFADDKRRTLDFAKALRQVLLPREGPPLLPELVDLTLSGRGGVTKAADLLDRHRFKQRFGQSEVGIPAVALAHGYQSTIAWVADLVGQILLEAEEAVQPSMMSGLVLVDEIDLYIHPALQVPLIRSLKQTFPRIQFVVTTHSPLVLAALRPDEDEVVRLAVDKDTGSVRRVDMKQGQLHEPDARLMTIAGVFQQYFGFERVFAAPEGRDLARYQSIASNPFRSDENEAEMQMLRADLVAAGIDPGYKPEKRVQGDQP